MGQEAEKGSQNLAYHQHLQAWAKELEIQAQL